MIKWLLFIGLTASLLTGQASSAFAVDMNATGHFYLEQTVSADQFFSTGAAFDLHLNEHTALTAGLGLTPAGLGWLLGGKLFLSRRDSLVRPYFSLEYGALRVAVNEDLTDQGLAPAGAFGIGLEWLPWIALFRQIENGELPESVSAFQLFTYHLEVSYPFYQAPPNSRVDSSIGSPQITVGIGVYFD